MIVKATILAWVALFVIYTAPCPAQESVNEAKNETSYGSSEFKRENFNFVTITGQETREKNFKLGAGMEVINIGGVNIVAPKGTKVEDKGSWIKVEDLGEFLGRRFYETENRLEQIEKQQELITKELKQIKKTLDELYKNSLISQ
jgi:hypothetical protein